MKGLRGLYLRGKIWWADYYANGVRIKESTGTANRREAEKFLALRRSEVHRSVFVKETKTTLEQLWGRYIPHAEMHKRSWKRDVQMYGNLKAFLGNPLLRDITPARLEKYQQARRDAKKAPATVNRELAVLKHMFVLAEEWGMHVGNPVKRVHFLPEDNLKCETLSMEEEQRLLAAAPPYLKDMVQFAVNTGLRRSDVFNLKWEDVNIEGKQLTMVTKKNRKPHTVFLNPAALEVVIRQRRDTEYVFTSPRTGGQTKCVRGALDAAVKRAGLKKITFHMFRHTVATRLLRRGANPMVVKKIMGHESFKTTERYLHTHDEEVREGMELLDGGNNLVTMQPRAAAG